MSDEKTRNITRRNALKITGATGLAAFAGCSEDGDDGDSDSDGDDGDSGSDGDAKLEVAHWWGEGDGKEAINSVMEGFQEAYPDVPVDENLVAGGAGQNLQDNIKTRIQNGNPPSTWQAWAGKNLLQYTENDLLVDIEDSVWSENDMKEGYRQGPQDAAAPDGNYVSVPINIHRLNNLFYNVEVVESAGVDPASIESPADLVEAFQAVVDDGNTALAHQTQAPWSSTQLFAQLLLGVSDADAYVAFTEGSVSDNEDAVKEAITKLDEFLEFAPEDAGSISWTEANNRVIDGGAAFIHQGDWAAGAYVNTEDFEFESDWDHVPFPGTAGEYVISMDSFPHPINNPTPEHTKKFLQYCGSVEAQEKFNPLKGSIPPRTDVSTEPFGPFLTRQIEQFRDADSTPPTMTHGLGLTAGQLSELKEVISQFHSDRDVDNAYQGMVGIFE